MSLFRYLFGSWLEKTRRHEAANLPLADISDTAQHWFWETDEGLRLLYFTPPFSQLNQWRPVGARLWDLEEVNPSQGWDAIKTAMAAQRDVTLTYVLNVGDVKCHQKLIGKAFFNSDGVFAGYRGACYDVSEEAEREAELLRQIDRLEERVAQTTHDLTSALELATQGNLAKASFIANISHEIRTPMNVILGATQLLESTEMSEQQTRWLENQRRAGAHLSSLINDVLDYSKIEAGRLELEERPVDLEAMISNAVQLFVGPIEDKGLELLVDERWTPGLVPLGDELRIGQIIINFLSNAVKFTKSGSVCLRVDGHVQGDEKVFLQCVVSDSGVGINETMQEHIFAAFQQAENATTRNYGGTGLGLSISAGLAALMGGSVGVESKVGQGSRFWFECVLPLEGAGYDVPSINAHERALLLGLQADAAEILQHQLEAVGFAVVVEDLEQWQPGDYGEDVLPSSIFFDERALASKNGCALLSTLPGMSLYCLSGPSHSVFSYHGLQCERLIKPLRRRLIWEVVGLRDSTPASVEDTRASHLTGTRVLVVDDDQVNRELLYDLFSSCDMTVLLADGGQSAVDLLVGGADVELVLMDLQMPGVDGLSASRAIIDALGAQAPPIVAFTANVSPQDFLSALDAGMVAFASKPVDFAGLLTVIDAVLSSAAELSLEGASLSSTDIRQACELLDAGDPEIQRWLNGRKVRLRLALPDKFGNIERAIDSFEFAEAARIIRDALPVPGSSTGKSA